MGVTKMKDGRGGARHLPYGVVAVAVLALLAGCTSVRQSLGLVHNAPNEFDVVNQPPLSMPPTYDLVTPNPGAPRPQSVSATNQAQSTVFGIQAPAQQGAPIPAGDNAGPTVAAAPLVPETSGGAGSAPTAGGGAATATFLNMAGANQAMPGIRAKVNEEAVANAAGDKSWLDTVLFWRTPQQPGTVVNAQAEARRLQQDAALGKPLTAGNTPVIERRKQAPLQGIFN